MDVVVIIGVGGMGMSIARRQGLGRQLLLADFNEQLLAASAQTLTGEGYSVDSCRVDVGSAESLVELARQASLLGAVVQVVHTAGLSPVQAPAAAILRVDLLGVAHMLDAFEKEIAPGGAGVVIASMAGSMAAGTLPAEMEGALALTPTDQLLALPLFASVTEPGAAYGIAKRANQLRVQAASVRWGKRAARVNSISPGVISTPMGREELAGASGEMMRAMVAASGTARLGTPADIAAATAFLLSPEASFITGTDLLVDGGVVAAMRSGALQI